MSPSVKTFEYREGPEALERFKRGMEALFKVPKTGGLKENKQARKPATFVARKHD